MEVRIGNGNDQEMWNFGKEKENKELMDVDKFTTNESTFEHASLKAWNVKRCTLVV
jgi:hypothetical protein